MAGALVWFITGTSSGFGRRLVNSALARGDFVIATARSLESVQDFLHSENVRLLQLDVDNGVEIIKAKVEEAVGFWGRIDVLVNNAGYSAKALFEEAGSDLFRRQFQTNVFGLIDVTAAVLPHMRERKSGTVVMMGSRSSWSPENPSSGGLGLYASSKAAVHTFSETLALEVAPFSIRILIVEPGAFLTEGIPSNPFFTGNQIPDYDASRAKCLASFEDFIDKVKGDPVKAMEVVVDVVRGEGKAKGRPWPLYLVLGDQAYRSVRDKCNKMLAVMEDWKEVTKDLEFDV